MPRISSAISVSAPASATSPEIATMMIAFLVSERASSWAICWRVTWRAWSCVASVRASSSGPSGAVAAAYWPSAASRRALVSAAICLVANTRLGASCIASVLTVRAAVR